MSEVFYIKQLYLQIIIISQLTVSTTESKILFNTGIIFINFVLFIVKYLQYIIFYLLFIDNILLEVL